MVEPRFIPPTAVVTVPELGHLVVIKVLAAQGLSVPTNTPDPITIGISGEYGSSPGFV
jgi:hypothetical protein